VAAVVGLLGVTWLALSPRLPHINVAASDDTPVKPNGEVLANAPKTYADSQSWDRRCREIWDRLSLPTSREAPRSL
jgi:hypothetical protein